MRIVQTTKKLKILHFDTESRPLGWKGQDYVHSELTAIAWSWADVDEVQSCALGIDSAKDMLKLFSLYWQAADIATGHYITGHDLDRINAMLIEYHLYPLSSKLVSDTCTHMVKQASFTKAQGELAQLYELAEEKRGMSALDWREANRLTPEGVSKTLERVEGDVIQHKALRRAMLEARILKPPKKWRP